MDSIANTEVQYSFNLQQLLKLLNTNESTYIASRTSELADEYAHLIKPKYIFKKALVDNITNNTVTIKNEIFNSKVLAKKLSGCNTVYIYIATCGKEIDNALKGISDPLDYYIVDQIMYTGYLSALNEMHQYMANELHIEKHNSLCPGSVPDWSVEEVIKLFNIFGEDYKKIGVNVLESGLIDPLKSTSGILYESDEPFHSCEICKKENCPNRRADFDEIKYLEMLGSQEMINC